MSRPLALLTGFGPFQGVTENPSGLVAQAVGADSPPGLEVRGAVLPVTFEGVAPKLRELLDSDDRTPELILGMGVHQGSTFRLESRASATLGSEKKDNDGVAAGIGIKYSGDERGPRRTPRGASRTAVDFDLTREVGSLLEREDA